MNDSQKFKLTDKQLEALDIVIDETYRDIMFYGGSRCVSGDTLLDGHIKTIEEMANDRSDYVKVFTSSGEQKAYPPFKKGESKMLLFEIENGKKIEVTSDHRFWDGKNWVFASTLEINDKISFSYQSFDFSPLVSNLEFYPLEFFLSVRHLREKLLNYQGDYSEHHHQYGQQLHQFLIFFQACRALQLYEVEHSHLHHSEYLPLLNIHDIHLGLPESINTLSDHKLFHPSKMDDSLGSCRFFESQSFFFSQIYELFLEQHEKCPIFLMRFYLPLSTELFFRSLFSLSSRFFFPEIPCSFDTPLVESYELKRIKKITLTAKKPYYTLSVPFFENYFANGFLNHNSGKTLLICYLIFLRACKVKSRHAILRSKFNHAKRSIFLDTIPKMLSMAMPNLGAKPNRSDYYYTLPNGSEIWIGGLDSKERTEKILGTEYSTLYFNETSQIDYVDILTAKTRLAEQNILIKKSFYDSNPPTKSAWQYLVFEKKLNPIDDEPLKSAEKYVSFRMNPIDNVENIDEEYISLLESMPEDQRKRFLEGEYLDISDGQAYYAFRVEDHVKTVKVQNSTHYVGMDFNVDPMTAVIFQVVNNQIQVFDEVFLNNSDTPRMINELLTRGHKGLEVIPDSTSKNRKTSGKSDFDLLKDAGYKVHWAHNPLVYDRVVNVNLLLTNNEIIIDPKCKKLINDLERVVWKDNQLDQKGANKMLTHISDALGYGAWKMKPLFDKKDRQKITIGNYR